MKNSDIQVKQMMHPTGKEYTDGKYNIKDFIYDGEIVKRYRTNYKEIWFRKVDDDNSWSVEVKGTLIDDKALEILKKAGK